MDKLLDYKRTYIASDGEEYIDLCIPAYDYSKVSVNNINRLNEDCNGRLDKVIYNNYISNTNNIDIVMYVNHIFNPFAIKEGDILYIPNGDDFYYYQEEPELIDGQTLSKKESNEDKKTYAETIKYLGKLGLGIK